MNNIRNNSIRNLFFNILQKMIGKKDIFCLDFTFNDYSALYHLSKFHDLAHLVADALDKNGSLENSEICNKFRNERNLAIYRYEQINYAFEEISEIFEKEKIFNIPLKGAILRSYYPQEWMRTSCDIDILVKADEIKKIVRLLTKKYAYQCVIHTQHDYSLYSPTGVHIELHFILIFHDKTGDEFTKKVWANSMPAEGYSYRLKMPNELFFAYHIAHMAQHILEGGGCGVKPFLDLKVIRKAMQIDVWEAQHVLDDLGLTTFAEKATQLSEFWFGEQERNEPLKEFEEFILCGGVYGTLENKIEIGATRKKGKVGYVCRRLFLPYRSLCLLYPSLKKCPILFPFYQIRRWFRVLKKDGVNISQAIKEVQSVSILENSEVQKISKMLETLGLK